MTARSRADHAGVDDLLRTRLDAQHGALTTADAYACGCTRDSLARLVAGGSLRRVHPGCFVDDVRYLKGTPEQRHALVTRAVVRSFDGRHAASHRSAAALHGLPLVALGDERVYLSRTTPGRPRRTRDVVIHPVLRATRLCHVGGVLAVLPATAIVQTTATAGLITGVAAADEALRRGKVTKAELADAVNQAGRCHGVADVRRMLELADGLSESPGESWTRVLFRGMGLPVPELQAEIRDEDGWFVARVDFLFRGQWTIVEFDGLLKYSGDNGRRTLIEEKRREDRLRSLGFNVVRLTWKDLATPSLVDRRIRAAFGRRAV